MADKLKMETKDLAEENYRKLIELFPNIVTETTDENGNVVRAIDADLLQQEINGKVLSDEKERYRLTWPDKTKHIVLGNQKTTNTLRLDREKSVGRDGIAGSIDTGNIYIEGDNLEALKLLRETYLGKVKMIYIDPPYNTGNDSFVYDDDSSISEEEFEERSGARDDEGNLIYDFRTNNELNGRFHTDWLNMMYPRLALARDLLSDDGVIFISIDDNEQENLKKLCDEIFGAENFINILSVKRGKKSLNSQFKNIRTINIGFEFIFVYSKSQGFHWSNPYTEANEKQKMGSWASLYNGSERPTMQYKIGEIEIHKGQWKWSRDRGLRAYGNWQKFIHEGGTEDKLKNYWEENKDKYLEETGFNLEFVKTTSSNAFYWVAPTDMVIMDTNLDYSSSGDTIVKSLIGPYFSSPKPLKLIKKIIDMACGGDKNALILDFFSGSATTAHAVMQLNAEDGGHRKFIMVQLPEECGEDTEAYKAGYKNICEIGEERIRRAGKKIKEESPLTTGDLDIGFRVYRVDDSNMKDVYYKPSETTQDMLETLAGNIKEDRTGEDLLVQIMLELGVDLSSKIDETEMSGKKVFSVSDGYMIACFDNDVTDDVVTQIAKTEPYYAVFRDSGMASDSVMTNYEQIFKTYSPKTIVKVL